MMTSLCQNLLLEWLGLMTNEGFIYLLYTNPHIFDNEGEGGRELGRTVWNIYYNVK